MLLILLLVSCLLSNRHILASDHGQLVVNTSPPPPAPSLTACPPLTVHLNAVHTLWQVGRQEQREDQGSRSKGHFVAVYPMHWGPMHWGTRAAPALWQDARLGAEGGGGVAHRIQIRVGVAPLPPIAEARCCLHTTAPCCGRF